MAVKQKQRVKADDREKQWPDALEVEPGEPGSIEQQLDMVETGTLKGDMVLGHRDEIHDIDDDEMSDEQEMDLNYRFDMSETAREGDEESGDEHSSGLQGGEPDIQHQEHIETGEPGDLTDKEEMIERKVRSA